MAELTSTTFTTTQIECLAGYDSQQINATVATGLTLAAGTFMAFNTSTEYWVAYVDGGANGTGTAAGILPYAVNSSSTGQNRPVDVPMLVKGAVYESALTGDDAAGIADLNGRLVPIGGDYNILIFG